MHSRAKTKKPITKIVVLSVIALVIMGSVGYAALHSNEKTPEPTAPKTATTADGEKVNLNPPTEGDKKATDEHKQAIVDKNNQQTSGVSNSSTKSANVVISNTSKTGMGAYITNIFEDGGTCTFTATLGSQQPITKTSSGVESGSYTQCAPVTFDSPLSNGDWQLTVSYVSGTTKGTATQSLRVE